MDKKQFLKALRQSLKKFSDEEVKEIINYYDEMISDKLERGQSESQIIAELGDIKTISNQIKADLVTDRINKKERPSMEKASNNFFIILMLFASPALLPIGFALAIAFFVIIVVCGSLMISFMGAALGLVVGFIPASIAAASQLGVGGALLAAGTMLLSAGLLALFSIIFYYVAKTIVLTISKGALSLYHKLSKKEAKQ